MQVEADIQPMISQPVQSNWFIRGTATQCRVIGATILRELHTRFGRENIGYLWFLVDPMLLATGITVVHLLVLRSMQDGLEVGPFYITGYCGYMIFRANVNRAPSIIDSNRTLLFHKNVTLVDLVLARCVLEAMAVLMAMYILLAATTAASLGHLPDRPLLIFAGVGLMFWLTTALAMILCALSEFTTMPERLTHPITYLIIPISGMFYRIEWMPEVVRKYLGWFPVPQIIELIREGEWSGLSSSYLNVPYLVGCCAVLTLLGLLGLGIARRRMHFS